MSDTDITKENLWVDLDCVQTRYDSQVVHKQLTYLPQRVFTV